MKTINLIIMIMFVSLGTADLILPKNELEENKNLSIYESKAENIALSNMPTILGDVTGDGVVDIDDMALCANEMTNYCCGTGCLCDLNGDGCVDAADLNIIYNQLCSYL